MAAPQTSPVRRRHGEELKSAILDAGWDELVEIGYARLTMGSVAARAHTSEPVLYRRWANKDELVLAVLGHYRDSHPVLAPDTGELRGDLIAQLTAASESLAGYFAITAAAAFSGLLADTGLSPSQIRDQMLGDGVMEDGTGLEQARNRVAYLRAQERGELDLEKLPTAVLAMPFDLLRHDLLMDLEPLEPERIRSIVDELFLPLLRAYQSAA